MSEFMKVTKGLTSINRPTKRGKEKSPSDGDCQCEKEIDDHLTGVSIIIDKVPRSVHHFGKLTTLITFHFLECLTIIIFVL
jgi:hypothetical protein